MVPVPQELLLLPDTEKCSQKLHLAMSFMAFNSLLTIGYHISQAYVIIGVTRELNRAALSGLVAFEKVSNFVGYFPCVHEKTLQIGIEH